MTLILIVFATLLTLCTAGTLFASHTTDGRIFDNKQREIGSIRRTYPDRYDLYDAKKRHTGYIRVRPDGTLDVFNQRERRIKTVIPPSQPPKR